MSEAPSERPSASEAPSERPSASEAPPERASIHEAPLARDPAVRVDTPAPGVARLVLARPARGNALSADLVEGLIAALAAACDDANVHTVLIAGDGAHLCTGFDLSGLETSSDGDLLARFVRIETLLAMLWHAPVRTVAIATGRTWGAGADLFAVCDHRIADPGASFRFPGAGFGLVLGTRRLAERVGADRARRWVIDGLQVDAAGALASGLATELADVAGDPGAALGLVPGAPAIDRATARAIRAATRADHRDADLAALVRSAAHPGLQARILAYRDRVQRAKAPRAAP
jgi:enoyl-CoA hydratase/carnithine racemase